MTAEYAKNERSLLKDAKLDRSMRKLTPTLTTRGAKVLLLLLRAVLWQPDVFLVAGCSRSHTVTRVASCVALLEPVADIVKTQKSHGREFSNLVFIRENSW